MKLFDLEAAKRGEPIVNRLGEKIYFVGMKRNGDVVVELVTGETSQYSRCRLYMAPKKRTVWVNLYGYCCASYHDTQEEADKASQGRRIGKAYSIEIEE